MRVTILMHWHPKARNTAGTKRRAELVMEPQHELMTLEPQHELSPELELITPELMTLESEDPKLDTLCADLERIATEMEVENLVLACLIANCAVGWTICCFANAHTTLPANCWSLIDPLVDRSLRSLRLGRRLGGRRKWHPAAECLER